MLSNLNLASREIKFLLIFLALFGLLQWLYFLIPWTVLKDIIYHYGIVTVSVDIINFFTNENLTAIENKLSSSKAILVIIRGCDGSGSLFLLCSAILAFSATVKDKIIGLIFGITLLYIVNQLRIIGLYFVVAYQKEYFLPIHTYYAPSFIVIICGLYFAWWAYRSANLTQEAK